MTIQPIKDKGQELPSLEGSTIGIFDNKQQFDGFSIALSQTGIDESRVLLLYGQDGLSLLERLPPFFIGDGETKDVRILIAELTDGHYGVAVSVKNRDEAAHVASIGVTHGGHHFSYFGRLVHEQLTA